MKKLSDLLIPIRTLRISNSEYYRLDDFQNALSEAKEDRLEVEDTVITPFYIINSKVYEIYDYELNLRMVDQPNIETFILNKTGKKSLDEVRDDIVHKFENCYLEVIRPQKHLPAYMLLQYIDYVQTSPGLITDISQYFHEYDTRKLYFQIY